MLNYQTKQDLKMYLIKNSHITSEYDFEKTEHFCYKNGVNFKVIMKEAVLWQNQFGNGHTNLTEKDFIYTIL